MSIFISQRKTPNKAQFQLHLNQPRQLQRCIKSRVECPHCVSIIIFSEELWKQHRDMNKRSFIYS